MRKSAGTKVVINVGQNNPPSDLPNTAPTTSQEDPDNTLHTRVETLDSTRRTVVSQSKNSPSTKPPKNNPKATKPSKKNPKTTKPKKEKKGKQVDKKEVEDLEPEPEYESIRDSIVHIHPGTVSHKVREYEHNMEQLTESVENP